MSIKIDTAAPESSRPGRPLIQTARLNDVDPRAWLAEVLACINDHNIHRLEELCSGTGRPSLPDWATS
jgi:hypothetical protein